MYTSPTIQNELIEICGDLIQNIIVSRINEAKYFSLLADETQDISRTEQLAICVRYFDSKESLIREDFLCFIAVSDVSALGLTITLLSTLTKMGINLNFMVGQGYDGAAVMSGKCKGVRALISEKYPKAQFVHCSAHVLNLVIGRSCELAVIRNCIGVVKSVINYFRISSQRHSILEKITKSNPNLSHKSILGLCETRWSEKHDSVSRFVELYCSIIEALNELKECGTKETSDQAYQYLFALTSAEFVVALLTLNKVFSYTSNLCKSFQKINVDLVQCCEHVDLVVGLLQKMRDSSENSFNDIYCLAERMLEDVGSEMKIPRVVERQSHRSNTPSSSANEYYTDEIYLYHFLIIF